MQYIPGTPFSDISAPFGQAEGTVNAEASGNDEVCQSLRRAKMGFISAMPRAQSRPVKRVGSSRDPVVTRTVDVHYKVKKGIQNTGYVVARDVLQLCSIGYRTRMKFDTISINKTNH